MVADGEDVMVGEVPKNTSEVIQVRRTEFNGHRLIDARCWLAPALPGGDSTPTRKGLSLPAATWRELLPLIEQAVEAEEEGADQ